jgi:Raf kinase inhibitor-like YbhB/YbcL family protein
MIRHWIFCGLLASALVIAACAEEAVAPTEMPAVVESPTQEEGVMAFSIRSDAFDQDQPIPSRFTCDGEDVSPALSWSDVPDGTQSFALIVDDPDAPRVFTHWVLYNLPASAQGLPEGVAKTDRPESGGFQGRTDFGNTGYGGPCPPPGRPHRYRFRLYALDGLIDLGPGATKQQVLDAIEGHILGQTQLVGTYQG